VKQRGGPSDALCPEIRKDTFQRIPIVENGDDELASLHGAELTCVGPQLRAKVANRKLCRPRNAPLILVNGAGAYSKQCLRHGPRRNRTMVGGSSGGVRDMVTTADPLYAFLTLQRALERSFESDWLRGSTTGTGTFPPINVFQRGDEFVALIELPSVSQEAIEIQAKDRSIRLSGRKAISVQDAASVHRRERVSGVFDRTITLPIQIDLDRLKAEYKDGVLALFIPRAERDKPRSIRIG
jgi:HSP20 family protein